MSGAKGPRNRMIRDDVLQKAAALFAERGFAATNLQDLADAVGLSRPALYYYFKNKEEVLTAIVQEATSYPVTILEKYRQMEELPPPERLRSAMRDLVTWVIRAPLIIKVLESGGANLPPELGEQHLKSRRHVLDSFVQMIEDGIKSGDFRPIDARLASFALIGMGNWTAWWYTPEGERSANEVASQFADMAICSLQWESRPANDVNSVTHSLSLLKSDLVQLERAIAGERESKSAKIRTPRKRPMQIVDRGVEKLT